MLKDEFMSIQLSKKFVEKILEDVTSAEKRQLRHNDKRRWEVYNGYLTPALKEAIEKEFKKPETIVNLIHRLVPINIVRKIVNKLAGLYIESPLREAGNESEDDQLLLNDYEHLARVNLRQKEANRYFKLYKRNLQEIFIDDKGIPQLRNIPRHLYEVYSFNELAPNQPDLVVKIIHEDNDPAKSKYVLWTDQEHIVVDGRGKTIQEEMLRMDNPEGINPYKTLPFVYVNESSNFIDPLPNDDLLRMGVLIPLLLSDLAFASKYQTWSIIYVTGFDGDIPASPNSVISLPLGPNGEKPEIGTVKPEFSMESQLMFVSDLTQALLSTNNLSSSGITGKLNVSNAASGISKALDESQSTEDKKDQQEYFLKAEDELWTKISRNMVPYWRVTNQLSPIINKEFNIDFFVNVELREPKVQITESDQVDLSKKRIDNGFSTYKRELSVLYPDMDDEEIQNLMQEIIEEKNMIKQKSLAYLDEVEDGQEMES